MIQAPQKKIILALLLNVTFISSGFSQGGNLDSTFGINGKVTTTISVHSSANAIALQSDGKIVAAGHSWDGFAITRYNTDGSLDITFGGDGIVTTLVDYAGDVSSVAIQPNGKILVAASGSLGCPIVRYNMNGSIDSSFGTNGMRYLFFFGYSHSPALAIQPDSKIVVSGTNEDVSFPWKDQIALARLDSNGFDDSTFAQSLTTFGDYSVGANAIALQPDGKILTAGYTDSSDEFHTYFAIARFKNDGRPDSSFGTFGHVTTDMGYSSHAYGVAIQPDGKIVVVGNGLFTIVRYNTDGSLDNSFNGTGALITPIESTSTARAVALQPDGKIVVAGSSFNGGNTHFAVARYNADGSLDQTFSNDGIVTTDFGSDDPGTSLVLQPDGKILVAGGQSDGFRLARYLPGLEVGILNLAADNLPLLIYPNPIHFQANLKYTLTHEECITISLYNMQGSQVQTFITNETRNEGEHIEVLDFSEALPSGEYILSISNEVHSQGIKIMKQ